MRSLARTANKLSRPPGVGFLSPTCLNSFGSKNESACPASAKARLAGQSAAEAFHQVTQRGGSRLGILDQRNQTCYQVDLSACMGAAGPLPSLSQFLTGQVRSALGNLLRTTLLMLFSRAMAAAFLNAPDSMAVSRAASNTDMSLGQRARACSNRQRVPAAPVVADQAQIGVAVVRVPGQTLFQLTGDTLPVFLFTPQVFPTFSVPGREQQGFSLARQTCAQSAASCLRLSG